MIFRLLSILLFIIFLLPAEIYAQSVNDIRKEKEKSEKEISYLNKLLGDAMHSKSASVGKLNILQQKIYQSKKILSSLNQEVKYIQNNISQNEQQIDVLQKDRNSMLDLYAKLVYGTWKRRNKADKLMFIFSSSDFNQAYNRFKYFQQIQEYSGRQLQLITQVNDSLNTKNQELGSLVIQKNAVLSDINQRNQELESEQVKENRYIKELQGKEKDVRRKLQTEMKNRQRLATKLNNLIARQAKKSGSSSSEYKLTPEEKLVSDDFAKNKGKLPWPVVEGFISEKFGIKVHSIYKHVETKNDGINITTSKNGTIRTVFQGTVSEILFFPGYNNVVIIRHGNYLTMYSNLIDVTVEKGMKVKTKDIIGKIAYDPEEGSVLNFQVWKDIEKLNPEFWLAK